MIAAADWVEAVKAAPSILWVVFAGLVVLLFRRAIAERLPALRSIELPGGVKAQFDAALTTASQKQGTPVSRDERTRLERRIARHADLLRTSSILWVDDDHASTRPEREALASLAVVVETASSNDEAERRLRAGGAFDLVISDMARPGDPTAGNKLADIVRETDPGLPVVLYVGKLEPERGTPPWVFGIADRPDELLHLALDALERRRD